MAEIPSNPTTWNYVQGLGRAPDKTGDIRFVTEASLDNWGNGAPHGSGSVKVTIKSNGNLGIGTTAPNHKLSVNGNIWCQELIVSMVDSAVPDFVFEPTYKLRSLAEVEQFVTQHKHLPDVPSESEIKKSGLKSSEMQMTLLQKVEELTLYVIAQNKKIDAQGREIDSLKKRIEAYHDSK